jgi:membrane fusion protein (multidrug efflux system)
MQVLQPTNGDPVGSMAQSPQSSRIAPGIVLAIALSGCGPAGENTPPAPAAASAPSVVVAPAEDADRPLEIEALGTARAMDAVEITSRVTNVVVAIEFDDGQSVKTGEVLVRLDDDEAGADLSLAEAALAESRSQYRRSKELFESRTVSESQMVELEARLRADEARVQAARARLDRTVIKAPFSGHVGLRRVSVGSLVTPGTVVTTLDDDSTVRLDVAVPERYLSLVSTGMRVDAHAAAYPDAVFTGTVTALDSRVDTVTRTMTVRATVPNPEGLIRSGMFVSVRLVGDARRVTLIPEESLVPEGEHQYVYVVEDGRAAKREVVLGQRRPGEVEILAGVSTGDLVVIEGTQKIADGVRVDVVKSPARLVRQP